VKKKTISEIKDGLASIKQLDLIFNYPAAKLTYFRIGGPIKLLLKPKNKTALIKCIQWFISNKIKFHVIGNGSNLLVSDQGVKAPVIITSQLNRIQQLTKSSILVESGCSNARLSMYLLKKGLSGAEFLSGIPGSIGGAIATNAGQKKESISDIIKNILVINKKGQLIKLSNREFEFKYRKSAIAKNKQFIIESVLKLKKTKRSLILKKIKNLSVSRTATQPIKYPSAGCVFKNPKNKYAGMILEKAGCKGLTVKQAQVSKLHANFIVNLGQAKAVDVKKLMQIMQKKAYNKFKVKLEPEIIELGFN
jgi:UDP-N-acetylmuramate dehydrogenase